MLDWVIIWMFSKQLVRISEGGPLGVIIESRDRVEIENTV
jgi:hypothetical protein